MRAERLLVSDVTVISTTQAGDPDEMGDPTEETSSTTYARAGYAWQTSRDDRTANTDLQVEEWRAVLDRKLAGLVDGTDRLTIEGITFELDGPPWPAKNPRTGRLEFLEVTLRRTA